MEMRCLRAWGLQPQLYTKELEHLTGLPNPQSSHEPPPPPAPYPLWVLSHITLEPDGSMEENMNK